MLSLLIKNVKLRNTKKPAISRLSVNISSIGYCYCCLTCIMNSDELTAFIND